MFILKRNQVIVTTLAIMVAVAGYLNFSETKEGSAEKTAMNITEEGDAYAILNDDGSIQPLADNDPAEEDDSTEMTMAEGEGAITVSSNEGAAVFVNSNAEASDYFAEAKLERDQSRAEQTDLLTEMINNDNISEEKKNECTDSMIEIQSRIEKETAAEAMIKSKGFNEAYVRIDDETVDVVVQKDSLSEAETAQIMDIVKRKTGMADDKIRISTLKSK